MRFICVKKDTRLGFCLFGEAFLANLAKNTLKNYASDYRFVHKSITRQVKLLVDRNVPLYTV